MDFLPILKFFSVPDDHHLRWHSPQQGFTAKQADHAYDYAKNQLP